MKKLLSVLLCALMICSSCIFVASAAEENFVVTVVNDLHLDFGDATVATVAKRNSLSEEYSHVSAGGQLPYESVAIIKAFLKNAAENESNTVLMPGDLTTVGTLEEHTAFIALIKEFEETTGKSVYVVPGNHDLFGTSVAEFETLYADFGYSEAIANDPATASYVAELGNGYRLLAIDSTEPGKSPHGADAELEKWVKAQCDAAKADGKKLVAIMHHNLLEHIPFENLLHSGSAVAGDISTFADTLADGGVKYVFSAHTHDHDIKKHTSAAGNVLYDCITTSLNAYPCAYRVVSFGEKVKIETRYVRSIDINLLPAGIHENALALAESNFLKYAKNCTYLGVEATISSYTKASTLKNLLKITDEQLKAVVEPVIDKACEALAYPIYNADATEEGQSLESLAGVFNTKLPATQYKTMIELVVAIYQGHAEGDENYAAYTDEMIVLQRALAVILNYALADVTAAEYNTVLTYLVGVLGVDIPEDIISFAGSAIERFKGSEMFITAALMPLVTTFSVDDAPSDVNVTLPGYGSDETAESLFDMIRNFFKKIFDFFYSLFAMIA